MIPENNSPFAKNIRQDEQDETDHENPVDPVKNNENDSTATY